MLRCSMILLLAFIVVPIVEIALLVHVGGWIGAWETVGLVVLTAVIGTVLFRTQGFIVLTRAQDTLAHGGFPAQELFDGVCILIAGVLLLTPGFVTDGIGLALLVPGLRNLIGRAVWRALLRSNRFEMRVHGGGFGPGPNGSGGPEGDVIEGEYSEVRPRPKDPPRNRLNHPHNPGDDS